jgi:hypothetical protein
VAVAEGARSRLPARAKARGCARERKMENRRAGLRRGVGLRDPTPPQRTIRGDLTKGRIRYEGRVGSAPVRNVQAPVAEVADPGREPEPERVAQEEHVIGKAERVGRVLFDPYIRFVVQQPVKHVRCVAHGRTDDLQKATFASGGDRGRAKCAKTLRQNARPWSTLRPQYLCATSFTSESANSGIYPSAEHLIELPVLRDDEPHNVFAALQGT